MRVYTKEFTLRTSQHQQLIDITQEVTAIVKSSGIKNGICNVFAPHATAGIILNESADPNIAIDFFNAINRAIPERAGYLHDRIDSNAAAHIKSAIVGAGKIIPVVEGRLILGTWQAIMFVELDGPRGHRRIVVQVMGEWLSNVSVAL